jgi:hypothetical protein
MSNLVRGLRAGLNDNQVFVEGLHQAGTNTYINDAVLTFSLFPGQDDTGTVIPGASGLTMPYVLLSDGNYRGTLPASVADSLVPGNPYTVVVVASNYGFEVQRTEIARIRAMN